MSSDLRQLALGPANRNIVFEQQQDGSTTARTERSRFDGGRLFRSTETSNQNKAQFQTLLGELAKDPRIGSSSGALQSAFAAIEKQAGSGGPLTTRLLSRALQAGDDYLAQAPRLKEQASQQMFGYGAGQLADPARFDRLAEQASEGRLQGFGELPTGLREAMRATVLDALREQIAQNGVTLDEIHPRTMHRMLEQAMTQSLPALEKMVAGHHDHPWQDAPRLIANLSQPLAATVDSVHTFAQMRMNARLCASSGQTEYAMARYDQIASAEIGAMDNKALLGLMRSLQSTDAIAFRLALAEAAAHPGNLRAQDLLEALNAFEGHVLDAFITRIGEGNPPDDTSTRDLTPGQLTALGSQVGKDFKNSLQQQPDNFLAGVRGAPRQLVDSGGARHVQGSGIDPIALKKVVQSAPLTINFAPDLFDRAIPRSNGSTPFTFVREDGSVNTEALRMKNIFELPSGVKGEDYLARRDVVERHQYPEMASREDRLGFRAQDRPLYTGANVGGQQLGSAGSYGNCFFVLKDELKQRALYAPTDTFFSHQWSITTESASAFKDAVVSALADQDSGLSEALRDAVNQRPALLVDLANKLDAAIRAGVQGAGRGDHTIEKWCAANLSALEASGQKYSLPLEDQGFLQALAMKAFMHPDVQGSTLEHVDRLFSHLNADQLTAMGQRVENPLAINTGLQDYIEAQVFGGIDLNRDVQELHVVLFSSERWMSSQEKENLENMRKVAADIGAKLVITVAENGVDALPKTLDPSSEEGRKRLQALRREQEVPVTRIDGRFPATDTVRDNPAVKATREGGLSAFKTGQLGSMLEIYRGHEQSFDPEGLHGRQHIGRVLIYANILANFFTEAGVEVDRHALYTTCAMHDSGREGNGVDRWEEESSDKALELLREQGITDQNYLELAKGCIKADATDRHSLEALILKSADSLDIIREKGMAGFDPKYLMFMRGDLELGPGLRIEQDVALRDALIQEVARFIDATNFHPPSEAAWMQARAELDRLSIELGKLGGQLTPEARELFDRQEQKMLEVRALGSKVQDEYREHSLTTDSIAQFGAMERELLNHPDKYPLMCKYYDPAH